MYLKFIHEANVAGGESLFLIANSGDGFFALYISEFKALVIVRNFQKVRFLFKKYMKIVVCFGLVE